jgi:hypothetical protein
VNISTLCRQRKTGIIPMMSSKYKYTDIKEMKTLQNEKLQRFFSCKWYIYRYIKSRWLTWARPVADTKKINIYGILVKSLMKRSLGRPRQTGLFGW